MNIYNMQSYFEVEFRDGSVIHSKDVSWHAYSVKKKVSKDDSFKLAYVSAFPVKSVLVHHNGLEKRLDIPEGSDMFQSIVGNTIITGGESRDSVLGRIVGIVKDNRVMEEYFLDGSSNNVIGYKYYE